MAGAVVLLLTALMRSRFCELFVHGKGGGVYDRITEQWWRQWRGDAEVLAPMTVASADAHLAFDVPVTDREALHRARWYRHHVPYNVDRLLGLEGPLVKQKWALIEAMSDHGRLPRRQRWLAFREIRRINDALCQAHPEPVQAADHQLAQARQGLGNAKVAARRDWCFALYPPATLESLRDAIEQTAPLCSSQTYPERR